METVADFIFLGSKIRDGDCSHEIKRQLLLGREAMTNLDRVFKSRDIILPTKIQIVKAMVFPVIMFKCESWTIKKTECQKSTLLNWDAREDFWESLDCKEIKVVNPKGNQPWIFSGRTDAEAEAPKLWPPDWRADSLEKILMLGKLEGKRKGAAEDEMVR